MIGVGRNAEVEALLEERFGVEDFPEDAPPFVDASRHVELARALRDDLGYRCFCFVVASHWPEVEAAKEGEKGDPEHYEVAYGLRKATRETALAVWRVRLEKGEAIESLVPLFEGADWQEREQYDLVGVVFAGHPDLRRIMMPEDWEGHPLRRDYPIDTKCPPWR